MVVVILFPPVEAVRNSRTVSLVVDTVLGKRRDLCARRSALKRNRVLVLRDLRPKTFRSSALNLRSVARSHYTTVGNHWPYLADMHCSHGRGPRQVFRSEIIQANVRCFCRKFPEHTFSFPFRDEGMRRRWSTGTSSVQSLQASSPLWPSLKTRTGRDWSIPCSFHPHVKSHVTPSISSFAAGAVF